MTRSRSAGIGDWSYTQFHDAVRLGKAPDGSTLCALMARFSPNDISDQGMPDLYAYLRTKPIVDVVNTGSFCP